MTYDTLHSSEDNLWSVLLMTGYITKANPEEDDDTVSLKIPNKEISSIFEDAVQEEEICIAPPTSATNRRNHP